MSKPDVAGRGETLSLPRDEVDPVRAIARRVALGVGILLLIALLVWLERDGYSDTDDKREPGDWLRLDMPLRR